MGESGHYYDNNGYEFSHLLRDISGQTSIIYRYDPDWTGLANKDDEYWTTEDISKSRFHGQIFSISNISGETQYITHAIGKNIDVSLNTYSNGSMNQDDISSVNISGVPFMGNYSLQTIEGNEDVKVLDLFEYIADTYTFVPIDTSNKTYTNARRNSDIEYEDTYAFDDLVKIKFINDKWEKYTSTDFVNYTATSIYYHSPTPNYGYGRIYDYNYSDINVNSILTSRGTVYGDPKDIATDIILPTLP
jgi:hypothetical protein|tara:strand:- start:6705 stop:7445 length:741 start_codon:yes stop_codon:yes gene_type:complete